MIKKYSSQRLAGLCDADNLEIPRDGGPPGWIDPARLSSAKRSTETDFVGTLTLIISVGQAGSTRFCIGDASPEDQQSPPTDGRFYSAEASKEDRRADLVESICGSKIVEDRSGRS